jgi:aminopeptidase N
MHHYIGESDWVTIETVISTSADQIAVAPGSLVEQWEKDGRRCFRYRVDHPSLNFYSFISARYEVAREKWNDVDVEVYYHPEHKWNVPRMVESIKSSLEYCSKNFGPYRHKQARIIEFPRTASFAQAFPGTMPYSESIGFIADLKDPEDIDFVFYVVAHEMAHQWWAHQVIGAKMQGATLLSESLAQYSALMIMEHHYGREMMRKFLKYEMDRYLSGRGQESADEKPLLQVNPSQGYVHYQKGSVVLYYLKEMITEERVNVALRNIVDKFAYRDPPYPNSYTLVDELKKQLPDELQYLIKDLFEDITLFANRTMEAKYSKLDSGKYHLVIDVECEKLKSDPKGKTEPAELHDWIEIGAFAKPEPKKKYGKQLYRERVFVDKAKSTFEFDVDEVPDLVGIDPYFLLVDRMPDDNLKKATLTTEL